MGYKDCESFRQSQARPAMGCDVAFLHAGWRSLAGSASQGRPRERAGLPERRPLLRGGADEKQAEGGGWKLEGRRQEEAKNWRCRSYEKDDAHTFHLLVFRWLYLDDLLGKRGCIKNLPPAFNCSNLYAASILFTYFLKLKTYPGLTERTNREQNRSIYYYRIFQLSCQRFLDSITAKK